MSVGQGPNVSSKPMSDAEKKMSDEQAQMVGVVQLSPENTWQKLLSEKGVKLKLQQA